MIVKASIEDAKKLTDIALISKAYWGYSKEDLESWREDLTITEELLKSSESYKYLFEDQIAGFYLLDRINHRTCYVDMLFVLPEYIGKGIGSKLLKYAIKSTRNNNVVSLHVLSDPNAEVFYEKHGFKTNNLRESSIPNRYLPEMEMLFSENM